MTVWTLRESDQAHAEREQALLNIVATRGPEYATRWHDGLLEAMRALCEFPGPRAWRQVESEALRRDVEVRRFVYGGPDRKRNPAVAHCLLYAVFDPLPGEAEGIVRLLRVVPAKGEEANLWSLTP